MRFALSFVLLFLPFAVQAGDDVETSGDILRAAIPLAAYAMTFHRDDPEGRVDRERV